MFRKFQQKKVLLGWFSGFILAILLVGCGDQTPGAYSGTPIANVPRLNLQNCAATTATTPKNTTPSPDNSQRVPVPNGYRLFISSLNPYGLAHPDSWVARDSQAQGNLKSDLFVAERTDKGTAFAFVLSEKLDKPGTDLTNYFEAKIKEAKANTENFEYETQADRLIAGQPAKVIAFNYEKPYQVQQVQVIFVSADRGWIVSYSATPNFGQRYCGDFSQILDTFTLTGVK